jgi:hypothetical protein
MKKGDGRRSSEANGSEEIARELFAEQPRGSGSIGPLVNIYADEALSEDEGTNGKEEIGAEVSFAEPLNMDELGPIVGLPLLNGDGETTRTEDVVAGEFPMLPESALFWEGFDKDEEERFPRLWNGDERNGTEEMQGNMFSMLPRSSGYTVPLRMEEEEERLMLLPLLNDDETNGRVELWHEVVPMRVDSSFSVARLSMDEPDPFMSCPLLSDDEIVSLFCPRSTVFGVEYNGDMGY